MGRCTYTFRKLVLHGMMVFPTLSYINTMYIVWFSLVDFLCFLLNASQYLLDSIAIEKIIKNEVIKVQGVRMILLSFQHLANGFLHSLLYYSHA